MNCSKKKTDLGIVQSRMETDGKGESEPINKMILPPVKQIIEELSLLKSS